MTIHSAQRSSDPRVLSGIMASAALERLKAEKHQDRTRTIYFDSLIRLLEMYRYDAFSAPDPQGVLERTSFSGPELQPSYAGLDKVKEALSGAHLEVYPALSKEEAVNRLRGILESVRDDGIGAADQGELTDARRFFEEFIKRLGVSV